MDLEEGNFTESYLNAKEKHRLEISKWYKHSRKDEYLAVQLKIHTKWRNLSQLIKSKRKILSNEEIEDLKDIAFRRAAKKRMEQLSPVLDELDRVPTPPSSSPSHASTSPTNASKHSKIKSDALIEMEALLKQREEAEVIENEKRKIRDIAQAFKTLLGRKNEADVEENENNEERGKKEIFRVLNNNNKNNNINNEIEMYLRQKIKEEDEDRERRKKKKWGEKEETKGKMEGKESERREHFIRPLSPTAVGFGYKTTLKLKREKDELDRDRREAKNNGDNNKEVEDEDDDGLSIYLNCCSENKITTLSAVVDSHGVSRRLHLHSLNLTSKHMHSLAFYLKNNNFINYIDISSNQLGPSNCFYLIEIFENKLKKYNQRKEKKKKDEEANKRESEEKKAEKEKEKDENLLMYLDVSGNGLGDKGVAMMVGVLNNIGGLKVLKLKDNNIANHAVAQVSQLIVKHGCVEILDVSHNLIGNDGGLAIANCLEGGRRIQNHLCVVDLSWNSIGSLAACEILDNAPDCTTLHTLNLSFNSITDDLAPSLSVVLSKSVSLTYLDLSHNKLGKGCAVSVATSLNAIKTINTLNIGFNYKMGYDGCLMVIEKLNTAGASLNVLGLENNSVEEGHRDIHALFTAINSNNNKRSKHIQVILEFPYNKMHKKGANLGPLVPFIFEDRRAETDGCALVDTEEIRGETVNNDLNVFKLKEMGLSVSDEEKLRALFVSWSCALSCLFSYYTAKANNKTLRMPIIGINILLNDCSLIDDSFTSLDVDRLYLKTLGRMKSLTKSSGLSRPFLILFLVLVALNKHPSISPYLAIKITFIHVLNSFVKMINIEGGGKEREIKGRKGNEEEELAVYMESMVSNNDVRSEREYNLYSSTINRVLYTFHQGLSHVYDKFSSIDSSYSQTKKFIYIRDFLFLMEECQKSSKSLGPLSENELVFIFLNSKLTCADELPQRDKAACYRYPNDGLTFLDFLESLYRIAIHKHNNRNRNNNNKIDGDNDIVSALVSVCIEIVSVLFGKGEWRGEKIWVMMMKIGDSKDDGKKESISNTQRLINSLITQKMTQFVKKV